MKEIVVKIWNENIKLAIKIGKHTTFNLQKYDGESWERYEIKKYLTKALVRGAHN